MRAADPAPISRRLLTVFGGVLLLVVGILLWWIAFNVMAAHEQRDVAVAQTQAQVTLAAEMIALATDVQGSRAALPAEVLAHSFPALSWERGAPSWGRLQRLYPEHGVAVRADVLAGIHARHEGRVRMFLSEGGFFLAMVLLGAWLIVRAMRHEVAMTRQQANFLSAVTHELKSPLASIRLYVETMQMRELPAETRGRYLGTMRRDVDRLEVLVGNLLAVARLDAGNFVVHAEAVELGQEVGALVSTLQAELDGRGVALQYGAPEQPLWVRMDVGALHTVVRNLLDNAAKYGRGAEPVRVILREAGGHVELEVRDGGIGIAAGELAKIFQKFYRVGDEMVRQSEGSGLGLYLVQALVRQSGGEVVARSDGLGRGSAFVVRLPRAPAAAPAAAAGGARSASWAAS